MVPTTAAAIVTAKRLQHGKWYDKMPLQMLVVRQETHRLHISIAFLK